MRAVAGNDGQRPVAALKTRERRAGRRRALEHNEQITCWRGENDIGVATSMAVRGRWHRAARRWAGWYPELRVGLRRPSHPRRGHLFEQVLMDGVMHGQGTRPGRSRAGSYLQA